ncbi:MAG: ribosomal-protein-alanine N-acetyltransferase [Acidobacteria bacterium]|nr:ribosomal protein S18-alanine N-acetyltransferase [Acidobacteriota bacterium]MCH8971891.1 ribosomal protein S18-alanine N-acetyltransferase [Acidobacteriota bacterium]MCZ6519808.1 ribosomal protein S18-alanine N-acetyltransferase [Actinomycetota bacterium]TDI51186.1 MAG: ribosomal-protein-alanine N-acetyltransferase [Acidobacteriota bacterium]TDI57562.1 MAG: ribosomal-protein-alanine N-acetyltransferase [Acidobacteriota bacterium]
MGVGVITIREFEPGDVEAALAMEEVAQPQPWTERIFNDELSAENRTYLVADDGAVCGYGGVMLMGDEAHITNLLVAPDHRGQGIGRRLMIGLIESAIAEGARHLILEVRSENEAARSLYSRLGLAPVGVRPGYYDDGDALIMWAHDIDSAEYAERLT